MTEPVVDPVVRAALRKLPVPEHHPGFWDRLDAELRDEHTPQPLPSTLPSSPTRSERRVVVPLESVPEPARPRRRSNRVLALVASAAAVLAAVAAASLVTSPDDDTSETAARTTGDTVSSESRTGTSASVDTADADASTGASATATDDGDRDSDEAEAPTTENTQQQEAARPETTSAPALAADAVLAWLDTFAEGDAGAAWAQLTPASKDHWGDDPALFHADGATGAFYGAWADAPPEILLSTTISDDDDGALEVVTLVADIAQEDGVATSSAGSPGAGHF